jgi:hypothetical protein
MEGKLSKFSRMCLPCLDYSLLPAIILYVSVYVVVGGYQGVYINSKKVLWGGVLYENKLCKVA